MFLSDELKPLSEIEKLPWELPPAQIEEAH
jgi:hypothetical protein